MLEKVILLRYGELYLKGRNRPFFENSLLKNIKRTLKNFENIQVSKADGRIYVTQNFTDTTTSKIREVEDFSFRCKASDKNYASIDNLDEKKSKCDEESKEYPILKEWLEIGDIIDRLKKVFGLVSISKAYRVSKDIDVIEKSTEYVLKEWLAINPECKSFKVQSKRSDKKFFLDSIELNIRIGEYLLNRIPELRVDVHKPHVTVYVEIREHAYIYSGIIPAAGGMPSATNGKAVLLLSGGIDSPVAGYMIAKRGVDLIAVHFHSFPYTGEQSKQKVIELSRILSLYCGQLKLYIVPFTQIQLEINDKCPQSYLTVIMRRYMMEIAQKIAIKEDARALVTGESIGQVASQTIDSLNVTNEAVTLPVFRPLIGMDKVEIMDKARSIGTYETSILPYEDCCTVFVPKNPAIYPTIQKALEAESLLDIDDFIEESITNAEIIIFS